MQKFDSNFFVVENKIGYTIFFFFQLKNFRALLT